MRARLDRHAKGVGFDNGTPVWARPAGDDAATMELASRSQAKATIRVLSGHVVVLDQKEVLARLTRGQSVIVRCTNYTDCTAEAG